MQINDLAEMTEIMEIMKNEDVAEELLSLYGFKELNPVQKEAINMGILDGKNLVVSAPTASGKTLAAELAILNTLSNKNGKVVYIVPLVSLAYEKYQTFREKYKKFKVAISVGDLDSSDPWLADYDLIVTSNEKLDSLMRHGSGWVKDVGLIVVDEVHVMNDVSRGPTLEILLTRLRSVAPAAQVVALSATIHNANDIADWLGADLIRSDFRPVKLYEGVCADSRIEFLEKEGYDLNTASNGLEQEAAITQNTIQLGKQVLIFVATRKYAEALAERLAKVVNPLLGRNEKQTLAEVSNKVLNVLEYPTRQCRKIAQCVRNGAAFHHAGLLSRQRQAIEENFRNGLVKVVVATPTLALGVNLPAFRVVVRDVKRYYQGLGSAYIPVLEYKQFVGRAGRPQYDRFGESILVAKTPNESRELTDRYILGEPEDIKSKLAVEPVLRMHTLALVANGFTKTEEELFDFFSKTFYAYQYGNISAIEDKLLEILDELEGWKFISRASESGGLEPTGLGKRVAELYIDPLTANHFVNCLKRMDSRKLDSHKPVKFSAKPFAVLQAISNTLEMRPMLSIHSGEFAELSETIARNDGMFLQPQPEQWDLEFDDFIRSVKTAKLFEGWIEEKTEDQIMSAFKVAPGELRSKLQIADWLIYSLQEIALLLGRKDSLRPIRKLRVRMKYGIREELMPLVRLAGIGRARARKLFSAKLKSIADLRAAPQASISKIIGPEVAASVKEQLAGRAGSRKTEKQKIFEDL